MGFTFVSYYQLRNTPFTVPGDTRPPAISPRPAVMEHHKTSCTSSTIFTNTVLAFFSIGSHFPNDEHGLGYFDGTLISLNTMTPFRGFTPIGTAIFSITVVMKSGVSLKAARCSGWTSTTSTDSE